jgi:hypothetical protein
LWRDGDQVKVTIWSTGGDRVSDALDLQRVPRFGLHHLAQPPQLKTRHRAPTAADGTLSWSPPKQAAIALITSFVSPGPRTGIETTPACSAG